VQTLIWCADWLPWPYSEDLIVAAYRLRWFVRPELRRRAERWAEHHATETGRRREIARGLVANLGRFVAMDSLAGLHDPEVRRRHLRIDGEHHLRGALALGGAVLVGFHAGPPGAPLLLRLAGHHVAFAGGRSHRRFIRDAWRPYLDPTDHLKFSESLGLAARAAGLLRARELLIGGGAIYITADGSGREIAHLEIPGARVSIRSGWWTLREQTGVPIVPVLVHLEGRTQVLTIAEPLPPAGTASVMDLQGCLDYLGGLLRAHVRRHPEQCVGYALRVWG